MFLIVHTKLPIRNYNRFEIDVNKLDVNFVFKSGKLYFVNIPKKSVNHNYTYLPTHNDQAGNLNLE